MTAQLHPLDKGWWDGKVMQYVQQRQLLTTDNLYPSLCSNVACWFWQTKYIQSYNSAAFSSYVTTIGTRDRTNIKPQDPGEPKEPFGLITPLFLQSPYPPLFSLDYCLFWVLLQYHFFSLTLLSFFIILHALPSSLSLSSHYSFAPSLFLKPHHSGYQSLPQRTSFYPKLPLLVCLFYYSGSLDPAPFQKATPFSKYNWWNRQNLFFPSSCTPSSLRSH